MRKVIRWEASDGSLHERRVDAAARERDIRRARAGVRYHFLICANVDADDAGRLPSWTDLDPDLEGDGATAMHYYTSPACERPLLEIGQRVRIFTPRTCPYHGKPGVVVARRLTEWESMGYMYTVVPDDRTTRPMYLCQGAVYGVEPWERRPWPNCGFGCEPEGTPA